MDDKYIPWSILIKYFKGEISSSEEAELLAWISMPECSQCCEHSGYL